MEEIHTYYGEENSEFFSLVLFCFDSCFYSSLLLLDEIKSNILRNLHLIGINIGRLNFDTHDFTNTNRTIP